MLKRSLKILSWIVGFGILIMLFIWIDSDELSRIFTMIGYVGVLVWLIFTLLARLLYTEVTVLPLSVFNAKIDRFDVFWINWVRTFANQILPLSGLAIYAKVIKNRTGISWSELSALATPQFFISALAVGLLGCLASLVVFGLERSGLVLCTLFACVSIFSLALIIRTATVMRALPKSLSSRLMNSAEAFDKISSRPQLILLLLVCYFGIVLLRVGRLWLLFKLSGLQLEWQTVLILGVIAESTLLIQLTPGGIGLREGSIFAGAVLLGVDSNIAASVAIIDRLLVIVMTVIFVLPSCYFLWKGQAKVNESIQS